MILTNLYEKLQVVQVQLHVKSAIAKEKCNLEQEQL